MTDRFETVIDGEKVNLMAVRGRVIVERFTERPEAIGGGLILLPQTVANKMRPFSGTVKAVGSDVKDLHPGDVIHWGVGCGVGVGENLHIVKRSEVFAREADV